MLAKDRLKAIYPRNCFFLSYEKNIDIENT